MKVSFVVVTYKRGPLLQQCLDSIYAQQGLSHYEIIVIDNGGEAVITPLLDPEIELRIQRPTENLGATGGRNLGMQLARGEYMVSLDDDACWHHPEDVARMITYLDENPRCGAVCAKSLDPNDQVIISQLPHPNKAYAIRLSEPTPVPYFYGVAHALRAEAIRTVGDYPVRYIIYMEEVDLSLRLVDAGYSIIYYPAVAAHHHQSNLGRPIAGNIYWKQSALNKCRMAWRLLPQPYPLTIGFVWSIAVLLKTGSPGLVASTWHDLWMERKVLQQERSPIRPATIRYLRRIGARLLY
jgi:GT2 family glycosyltransferase